MLASLLANITKREGITVKKSPEIHDSVEGVCVHVEHWCSDDVLRETSALINE